MRRVAIVASVCAVALGGMAGAGLADSVHGYAGPGEWFDPGEGHGSSYDSICGRWVDNNFAKGQGAWGLITFINPSGGWSYTQQGPGNLFGSLPNHRWTKKLHCKNNRSSTYQGGCFGFIRNYPCA